MAFLTLALRRLTSRGAILGCHSVTHGPDGGDAAIHVPLGELQRAVTLMEELGEIIPLRDLLDRHDGGKPTAGLYALTFDDAYVALEAARPVLGDGRTPLTAFAVSDALESGHMFWWDRLEDLLARVTRERWVRFEDTCGLPQAFRVGHAGDMGPLWPLRQYILSSFLGRLPAHMDEALSALEREAGFRTTQRSMNRDELIRFSRQPGVDIGVHTRTHPVLPLLPEREMLQEIQESYHRLRDICPQTVPVLAIPYGLFDRRTAETARAAGMTGALTLEAMVLRTLGAGGTSRICLMRGIPEWKLAALLSGVAERWTRPDPGHLPAMPSATT